MAGKSRSSRLLTEDQCPSKITVQPLDDSNVKHLLLSLKELFSSALGPTGRLKFFQTSSGGYVTVTSTSSRILHSLSGLSHPILRLILSAVRGHLDAYNDGGLRTAMLLLSLLQSSLDLPVPRALVTQINQHLLEAIINHLQSCCWRMKIDIGDMKSMLSIVNSIVGTKPACHLSETEKRHVSVLIIQAFLQSLPSSTNKAPSAGLKLAVPVQIVTFEGESVKDSKVLPGLLIHTPEIPTFQRCGRSLVSHGAKVALYNISMAGDTDEWFSSNIKTETMSGSYNFSAANTVLLHLLKVADWLINSGVNVIACQKCVHPALKRYLRDKGAFVLERLSILHISAVQRLTGASILSTFSTDIPESSFGQLEKIEHIMLSDKSYLHLLPQSSQESPSVCTLLLCSSDETSLDELKMVCQASLSALHETLACPFVLPGAGCLDTHLASFLWQYGHNSGSKIASELGCTKGQVVTVINNVASSLESLARSLEHDGGGHVTDSANQHHWSVPPGALELKPSMPCCTCGVVSRDETMWWSIMGDIEGCVLQNSCDDEINRCYIADAVKKTFDNLVLDMFSVKINCYRTAFETANAVLRVHCVICSSIAD